MADIVQTSADTTARDGSYVDWNCAFAGAVLAAAVAFVLLTFGSAIGLSMVSPWTGSGISGTTFAVITALWAVLVQVTAFAAGGYVAGRMRRPWRDAKREEAEFRDGTHGAVVWAAGVVLGAMLLAWTAAGAARTAADAGSAALGKVVQTSNTDPVTYAVDTLFRAPERSATAAAPGTPPAPAGATPAPAATTASTPTGSAEEIKTEAARVLAMSTVRGEISAADRAHLARLVSARTGMSQADAEQRVNQVITATKETADRARKVGIVAAFLTAASLLAGLAAAWSGARLGGTHRDEGLIWRGFARRPVIGTTVPRP